MIDTADARSIITKDVPKVSNAIITDFHDYLLANNKYVRGYQTMGEKMKAERRAARNEGREPQQFKLLFSLKEHVRLVITLRFHLQLIDSRSLPSASTTYLALMRWPQSSPTLATVPSHRPILPHGRMAGASKFSNRLIQPSLLFSTHCSSQMAIPVTTST